jgi:lipopolysaccharide export system ATP-binding protein
MKNNVGTIKVNKIVKSYNGRVVLRGVDIDLHQGEIVGLLGPNGAGKTTSFNIITGIIKADNGSIFLNDQNITNLPLYKRARLGISYLPQETSIFRKMTVFDNIMTVLEIIEEDPLKHQSLCEKLMAEFSIAHLANSLGESLSGGEKRRVEIARIIAAKPKFILFDEPLAAIDPLAIIEIRDLIYHLKDRGIGVLITDHNVRETLDLIDRAYIIHDGLVLAHGTPLEIVNNKQVKKVYLGEGFKHLT